MLGRRRSTRPSGKCTASSLPPRVPSRSGFRSIVTSSPAFTESAVQPARIICPTELLSSVHRRAVPSSPSTMMWSQQCGLAHSNSVTVAVKVICVSVSYAAREWCPDAGTESAITTTAERPKVFNFMTVSRRMIHPVGESGPACKSGLGQLDNVINNIITCIAVGGSWSGAQWLPGF